MSDGDDEDGKKLPGRRKQPDVGNGFYRGRLVERMQDQQNNLQQNPTLPPLVPEVVSMWLEPPAKCFEAAASYQNVNDECTQQVPAAFACAELLWVEIVKSSTQPCEHVCLTEHEASIIKFIQPWSKSHDAL